MIRAPTQSDRVSNIAGRIEKIRPPTIAEPYAKEVLAMYERPPHCLHFAGCAAEDHHLEWNPMLFVPQCGQRAILVRSNDRVERPATLPLAGCRASQQPVGNQGAVHENPRSAPTRC